MGKISYIIATSTSQTDYEDLKKFSDNCDFIHLDIMEYTFEKTQSFVTFRATIKCSEKDCSFVEKSRFVRNSKGNKGWLYADGEFIKY
jgi:SEC-C motif-containing protein